MTEDLAQRLGAVDRIPITSRDQWLGLRRQDVTASDVASICGCGRRTMLAVWHEKVSNESDNADNEMMQRGRWLEPAIWEAMREKTPFELQKEKIYLKAHAIRLGATPDAKAMLYVPFEYDGFLFEPGRWNIQGKVVSRPIFNRDWRSTENEDEEDARKLGPIVPPLGYQLQTVTETMLAEQSLGRPVKAALAALVIDTFSAKLHLVPIPRHPAAEQKILQITASFWADIDAGRQPDVIPGEDGETLAAMYPQDDGTEIDLRGDNNLPGLFDERQRLGKETTISEARRNEIRDIFRSAMGSHAYARLADGRRVSLKTIRKDSYIVKAQEYRMLCLAKD